MSEIEELCAVAARIRDEGRSFLLATVVGVRGSAYRRSGARMLVDGDRWLAGSVSAGCIERDVLLRGAYRARNGPVVVEYDGSEGASGCEGVVEVLLERIGGDLFDPLEFAAGCLAGTPGTLVTVTSGPEVGRRIAIREGAVVVSTVEDLALRAALVAEALGVPSGTRVVRRGDVTALVEVITAAPHLFVVGTQHDAHALLVLAQAAGFGATAFGTSTSTSLREQFGDALVVADPEAVARAVDRHPCAAVVVMANDEARDRACLAALLGTKARYIGIAGPRSRTLELLDPISSPTALERIHGPAGLDLGAEGPEAVALSIMAEIQACLAEADARPLRERDPEVLEPRALAG